MEQSEPDKDTPTCSEETCSEDADLWIHHIGKWRAYCENHAVNIHPSLEIKAWLWSGYAKPVEIGRPDSPPDEPRNRREKEFREMVDSAMKNQ